MQARMLRWPSLALYMLALAGCQQRQSVAMKLVPVPPPQPFVFYDETGDPSERAPALSEFELRQIVDWVATQAADPIWLIRVRPTVALGMGERGWVTAYLVPDRLTSRIRMGRAYDVPESKEHSGIHSPWTYAQVSVPNRSFTGSLTKPSTAELPFKWPEVKELNIEETSSMSKEELTNIVDFVCQRANYEKWAGENDLNSAKMSFVSYGQPIFEMGRRGNEIVVTFGYLHGPLWGGGYQVTIERTATGYRIADVCGWVS